MSEQVGIVFIGGPHNGREITIPASHRTAWIRLPVPQLVNWRTIINEAPTPQTDGQKAEYQIAIVDGMPSIDDTGRYRYEHVRTT